MNKNISALHPEILDNTRQQALLSLTPCAKEFILGGGTALALQIGHRKSFDFDFFSVSPIEKSLIERISKEMSIFNIAFDMSGELTFFTKDEVKITFLHYPFTYIYPLETLLEGLSMFSIKDIAVKKAYAIGRRGEYRDYFDLYSILKDNYADLRQIILDAKNIYGSVFEEKIFLQQLVYFKDLLNFEIIPAEKSIPTPQEVENFLQNLVKEHI